MARILRDYKCQEHGFFEGFEAVCPEGCTGDFILQVFLKSPGFVSDKTKAGDKHIKSLAAEFDMSDIKSTRTGENQAGYLTRKNKFSEKDYAEAEKYATRKKPGRPRKGKAAAETPPQVAQEARAGDSAIWGGGFQGMNMASVLAGRFGQSVKGEQVGLTPRDAGINNGPQVDPRATLRDPDNMTIKK